MARRQKVSGWDEIDGGAAFIVPYTLLRHPNFKRLSPWAHKLIHDLGTQYTGFNNGYLCASWSLMRNQHWKSSATLQLATLELEHYGIIERTQQGGRNKPNLHAITWRSVNHKKEQPLDPGWGVSGKPSNAWKQDKPDFTRAVGKRKQGAQRTKNVPL